MIKLRPYKPLHQYYEESAHKMYGKNHAASKIMESAEYFTNIKVTPTKYIESFWCQTNAPSYNPYHMRVIRHLSWYMHIIECNEIH